LDEPTSSVDSHSSTQLYDLLAKLNDHIAILLISHDLTAISTYVKTIGCVNRRLVYSGTKEITSDMLDIAYECPVDLVAHGLPHRVLPSHQEGHQHD
jgi:zinc transport system ATP-binding protein